MGSAKSCCVFSVFVFLMSSTGWVSAQIRDGEDPDLVWANPQIRLNEHQNIVVSTDFGSVQEIQIHGSGLVFGGDPGPFLSADVLEDATILRAETPIVLDLSLIHI